MRIILCGTQGIGKTKNAPRLAELLHIETIVDDWDGETPLPPGAIAISNAEYIFPENAIAIHAESEKALEGLLNRLEGLLHAQPLRPHFSTSFVPCYCHSVTKEGCTCHQGGASVPPAAGSLEHPNLNGSNQLVNHSRRWPVTCFICEMSESPQVGDQAEGVKLPSHGGDESA